MLSAQLTNILIEGSNIEQIRLCAGISDEENNVILQEIESNFIKHKDLVYNNDGKAENSFVLNVPVSANSLGEFNFIELSF